MTGPTPRQLDVLKLVLGGGTMREIGRALGIASTNGVNDHLLALIQKGLVWASKPHAKTHRYQVTVKGMAALGLRRCTACHGDGTVRA